MFVRIVNFVRYFNFVRYVNFVSFFCILGFVWMVCFVYIVSFVEENVLIGNCKFWRVLDNSSLLVMVLLMCEIKRIIIIYV